MFSVGDFSPSFNMSSFETFPEIHSILFTELDTIPSYKMNREINDIVISSVKHYFINNFRSLSPKKTHNLFELFRRHYNTMIEDYPYKASELKEYLLEKHYSTDAIGYINWILQLYMRKIIALSEERKFVWNENWRMNSFQLDEM